MNQKQNNDQEIDIISLINLLANKTKSFFVLIINFLISIFNLFISLLFVIKKNYILLITAVIIGGLTEYIFKKKFYKPIYTSSLTLSPNFGSTYHLYGNIDFYKSLIKEQDFKKLKSYLNLDSSDSKSLKGISIIPYTNELEKLENFRVLLGSADSITASKLEYAVHNKNIPFDSYSKHVITLELNNNKVPTQIEQRIIKNIENNFYYKNKKETYLENLEIKKQYILESIGKLDTLLFAEMKKPKGENSGTTIVLDENQNENIDLQLFDRYKSIRNELVEINYDLNDKKHVINTINSFSDLASEEDSNFMIITPLFFLMTLFLILLFELNKKLNNDPYIKKLS